MLVQEGDFGFVYNGDQSKFSKAVAIVMGSEWTHSFTCVGTLNSLDMLGETCDSEVVVNRLDRYLDGRKIIIFRLRNTTKEIRNTMVNAVLKSLGFPYGFRKFFAMGLRRLLKRVYIKIKVWFTGEKVCCDLVYDMLDSVDNPLRFIERGDTEDLYQAVIKYPEYFEVIYVNQ